MHLLTIFHYLTPFSHFPMQVCVDMSACEIEQFEFVTEPLDYTQEQWDDKCYVCQAFAKDLEVSAWCSFYFLSHCPFY